MLFRVNWAPTLPYHGNCSLYVSFQSFNLHKIVTVQSLFTLFKPYGNIVSVIMKQNKIDEV